MLHAQQTPMPSGCSLEEHTAGDKEVEEQKQTNKETNKNSNLVLQLLLCLFVLITFQLQSMACCASSLAPSGASPPSDIRSWDPPAPALSLPIQDI